MKRKAVVLLSGGLDSTVTLYLAMKDGYECECLTFDYGQRHKNEVDRAAKIAGHAGVRHHIVKLEFPWKGSSLVDKSVNVPSGRSRSQIGSDIPSTYVPARNTIFLSIAASCAEATGSSLVYIGAHSEDSSGYPDCRKEYLEAFDRAIMLGTREGSAGRLRMRFPLISKTKKEIIRLGAALGAPLQYTWSCYQAEAAPCGVCDSCVIRARGFEEAGIEDLSYA
jgi:7-cyano-7-deazaguanine synthase